MVDASIRPVFSRPRLTSTIERTVFREAGRLYAGNTAGVMFTYTFTPEELHTRFGTIVELIFNLLGDVETSEANKQFKLVLNGVDSDTITGMYAIESSSESFALSCFIDNPNKTNTITLNLVTNGGNDVIIRSVECVARIVE